MLRACAAWFGSSQSSGAIRELERGLSGRRSCGVRSKPCGDTSGDRAAGHKVEAVPQRFWAAFHGCKNLACILTGEPQEYSPPRNFTAFAIRSIAVVGVDAEAEDGVDFHGLFATHGGAELPAWQGGHHVGGHGCRARLQHA